MNAKLFDEIFTLNEQTWARLLSTMLSDDDIGVVLRVHLLTEKMLEAWSCAASNNPKLFEGFGESLTMSYAAKLKLAQNFGLNEFSYKELKMINRIRNTRSHQIDNAEVTDSEIQKMIALISDGGQESLVKEEKFGLLVDDVGIHLHDPKNTNREKFIATLAGVIHRVLTQVHKKSTGFKELL